VHKKRTSFCTPLLYASSITAALGGSW